MLRWVVLISLCGLIDLLQEAEGCNEAVCGSIVSKCLLTQSCKCDFKKDCSCCKECANCLNYLYDECCSCVDMCPKPNDTRSALSKQSHVEDLKLDFLDLFHALTEAPDSQDRWTSFTFPVDFNILSAPKSDIKLKLQSIEQEVVPIKPNITTLNCSVAYMSICMSWEKCKHNCQSMGASSMRWFHDGCCECVGNYCINYGINESRCLKCSRNDEIDNDDFDSLVDDDKDYGEDDEYPIDDDDN